MRALLLCLLIPLALVSAAGCSGNQLDCASYCSKAVECNSSQKSDDCTKACTTLNDVGNSDYIGAVDACQAKSCDQIASCNQSAALSCTTDLNPFFDRYCAKLVTCTPGLTQELCKAGIASISGSLSYAKCLNDGALSDLAGCIEDAQCSTFQADSGKCVSTAFNIDISGSG